jgi:exodeoxyribonuclease VIII
MSRGQFLDFERGVYEGLDYETYASIEAWRSHDLTSLIRCGFTWKNENPMKETPALMEGRVQHTVFLEHHKFAEEFAIEPNVDRRTKVGKAEYADWKETLDGRSPIKQDMYDICMERREVVEKFIPGPNDRAELTVCFVWRGEPCKARFDWHTGTDVWDLKTCRDASPRGFKTAINSFRYYQQAAFYLAAARHAGLRADRFMFLAQEKAHPFPFAVYTLSPEAIHYGDVRNEQALSLGKQIVSGEIEPQPFNGYGELVEFDADDLW